MRHLRTPAAAALLACLALSGPSLRAQDADTPLDRALQKIEAIIAGLKAAPNPDARLIADLESAAANLREAKRSPGGDPAAPGGPPPAGGGVQEYFFKQTMDSFTRGVELKDSERTLAEEVLREFVVDYDLAKKHDDEKSKAVVRDHTEKRIARSFDQKDSNKLKDNLDGIIKFWDRSWNRRGK